MIIIYYGNGKGKTTAALGLALRASGYNTRILVAQFIKSPKSLSGEDKALKKITNLYHKKFGLGFVGLLSDSHTPDQHKDAAQKALKYIIENIANYEVIICDEILGAIKGGLISQKQVSQLIKSIPPSKSLVLTGRPKYKRLITLADLATEMKEVKHPFQKGKMAEKGIDY